MKNLTTLFFVLYLTSTVFAQSVNVQPIPPIKDELRQQYTQSDLEIFRLKEKNGEIPPQGGIIYNSAAADALVNNNAGATGSGYFTQSEMSIIAFGNNVVIGFNDSGSNSGGSNKFTGWSYSTDGGATFADGGTLPTNSGGDAGDPVLARNESTGRVYLSTLGYSTTTIQMFRSDNNGLTWSAPVNATPGGSNEDKQWHTVDNFAGTGNGNVYLISRRFGGVGGIYLFRSTNNGDTFVPNGGVNIFNGGQGAFVAVGPDHSVYAFYYNGTTSILVRKSTDFGVTFGSPVTVFSGLTGPLVNGDLDLRGIRQGTSTPEYFRSNSFPHVAVNPVSGHLYATFNNNPAGTDKANIYMVMSTDGGATWTAPVQVNDDVTTTDQWQPTIAVTPDGANIGIFYYSRQEDIAANNLFKYYGRTGTISGSVVTFTPSFAISDVASLPEFGRDVVINSVYMGDYQHATATNDAFHVTWSDNRNDLAGGAPRKDPNVYYEKILIGPPCPIGQASNPNPPNGASGLPINGNTASWTNGAGTVNVELWFGPSGSVVKVYDGVPITSYNLPTLNYSTPYYWYVICKDATCSTQGPIWSFTTIQDPNLVIDTINVYPQNVSYWTGTTTASAKTEISLMRIVSNGGEQAWAKFDISSIPLGSTITSITLNWYIQSQNCPYFYINALPIDPVTATPSALYSAITGGIQYYAYTTCPPVGWESEVLGGNANADLAASLPNGWFAISFFEYETFGTYTFTADGWAQTNKPYLNIVYSYIVPVELTSFTATSIQNDVTLKWSTATETNNQGFQIERKSDSGSFEQVGYVAGFGTTTEPKAYSFIDTELNEGNYTYRLKQIDFNGSYEYSEEVNVDITLPLEYALEQNYPNPFNPSTTIKYSIAEDGFVKLAVYNLLGEEVATIVNNVQKAGRYEVNFNASGLASGVYVYRIEASNFTSVKKLMLLK
jgi:hypothetical protein